MVNVYGELVGGIIEKKKRDRERGKQNKTIAITTTEVKETVLKEAVKPQTIYFNDSIKRKQKQNTRTATKIQAVFNTHKFSSSLV